jgi:hypothetical protein
MNTQKKLFFIILLCSSSTLAYEITLTRIFSISLWYHFAFMIISIAMLGIGASGTFLSLFPKLGNASLLCTYCLFLGSGISLSYLLANQIPFDPVKLSWSKAQILYIGLYYITLSVPFFLTGLIVSQSLSLYSEKSGLIYSADLLGAGLGAAGILSVMAFTAPEKAVFILSSIALVATFFCGGRKLIMISIILIGINTSLIIFHPLFINLRISHYKGLQMALRYPGAEHLKTYYSSFSRIDTFSSPAVRFAPGLSFTYLEELPKQIGFSIDGGDINAITDVREKSALKFLQYLPSALPYEINKHMLPPCSLLNKEDSFLIVDSGGGVQSLIADYYGFSNVYKTERNHLLREILQKDFHEFSCGIYSENTWTGLGRSWLKKINKHFEIIDISLMGSIPSGTFGISEDYRLTVEAFKEYITHLKPEGMMSINLFILPPARIELRIVDTAITALEERGIKDAENHIAAIRSWGTICILIKKSAFSSHEIETIKAFSGDLGFDLIYYPGIREEEINIHIRMPSNEYFTAFKNLLNPETRDDFIKNYVFDIKAVRDENPFFHYYLKMRNINDIYRIMGEKWQYLIEEGYILLAVFLQVFFISLILILLPTITLQKATAEIISSNLNILTYFAFLAIGFMSLEITFVQKMILPLENPSYAIATVLVSILTSSGIGSLLSYRLKSLGSSFICLIITFLIIVYSILLPVLSDIISPYPLPLKVIMAFFIIMPAGLLIGIPFPTGLKILGERNRSLIPLAWAINGCLSVLAPVLTVMIAIDFGFKRVLWLSALSYLLAFLNLRIFLKKDSTNPKNAFDLNI